VKNTLNLQLYCRSNHRDVKHVLRCSNWSSDRYTYTSLKFTISSYAGDSNRTDLSPW